MHDSEVSTPRHFNDPETGRPITQLTSGDCFDYPLYFFIPTVTRDGRSIVFYRHRGDDIQLYRLDVESGHTVCLTNASTPNALWRPWLRDRPASGVRDQLSAFNVVTDEAIYFDGNEIRAVHIFSLEDRLLHVVPEDRTPCGLTGVSPDGRLFSFPHIDRAWWETNLSREPPKHQAQDCRLDVLDMSTGKVVTPVRLNTWITHSNFYDNTRILLCHLASERAILLTDVGGGWYTHLRTQDEKGQTCHYQVTEKGIAYEVGQKTLGLCKPDGPTFTEYEIDGPALSHIGFDPAGRLWFYETPDDVDGRNVCFLPSMESGKSNKAVPLIGRAKTYGVNQTSHLHPRVMPNRQHMLFTSGDAGSETNHLCLMDITDLADTKRV